MTSFFDKAKDKLQDLVDQHGEKIGDGVDQAADKADSMTGGKYSEHIDTGADRVKDYADGLDGQDDDIPDVGGTTTPPATGTAPSAVPPPQP